MKGHRDKVRLKTAAPAVDNRYREGAMHAIVWFLLAALGAAAARGDEERRAQYLFADHAPLAPEGARTAHTR
jgi:hypothetical protein